MSMQVSNEEVWVAQCSSSCLDEEWVGAEIMHSEVKSELVTARASRSLDIGLF